MCTPTCSGRSRDDTRSALCGGTTSALAFVDALEGETPGPGGGQRTLAGEMPAALIDLAFHAVIWEPRRLPARATCMTSRRWGWAASSCGSAYIELGIQADDDVAFAVMQEAAELGVVVLAHCENGRVIDVLTRQFVERESSASSRFPAAARSRWKRSASIASWYMAELAGATPYVVHVTGRSAVGGNRGRPPPGHDRARRGVPSSPARSTSPTTAGRTACGT